MGICPTCSICRANVENLSPPVTAWGVGDNFHNENKKILFVGKIIGKKNIPWDNAEATIEGLKLLRTPKGNV